MKKNLSLIFITALIGFFGLTNFAQAQAGESITGYVTDITLNADSSIQVKEKINYDFGSEQRHGIFRNIPYKYKARGGTFKLRISDITVTGKDGAEVRFQKSTSGDEIELKIGDPDVTVTGVNEYNISYTVKRAVNFFEEHDELYWNAIGTGWSVPIAGGQAIVHAPASVTKVQCYTGEDGSTDQNCSVIGGNTENVTYTSSAVLQPGEGLTIVAGLPKGILAEPTGFQKFMDIIRDNGILILPVLVFGIMFYLWNRYGKDAKSKDSIVAQYDAPDKMSAMYLGSLIHNGTENKDIAAEVVYLAAHGYITIKRTETTKMLLFKGADYEFTKLDKSPDGLPKQTRALLDDLFPGGQNTSNLSELKTNRTFGASLMKIKSDVMKELVKDGYYRANPTTVKGVWLVLGIIGTVATAFLLGNFIGYLGVIAAIVSGVIVVIFSFIMPARTQKGADTAAHIHGLEDYLTVAEKDRLKFHNAPEKSPQHFELLLPFAIALGVEEAWAGQFKDLTQAPSWYSDSSGSAFNAAMFSNSIHNFSDSMQSAARAVTTASSGGSGFSGGGSGGGGGGGGGGSW